MESRTIKRSLKRALLILSGFVVLGYISSLLSVGKCESVVGIRIAADIGQRNVFVLPEASNYAKNRLERAGFLAKRCRENEHCFPWAELVGLPSVWPFTVNVTWGYVAAPLVGQGNRTTFLCFFGLVFEVSEKGRWVT